LQYAVEQKVPKNFTIVSLKYYQKNSSLNKQLVIALECCTTLEAVQCPWCS